MKFSIRRLDSFDCLFSRLQRKAVRLGLPSPSYAVTGERRETADIFEISEGESRKVGSQDVVVHDVEISGLDPVRLDGWNFAARIETLPVGNLVYALPGLELPARFAASGCVCEHCNVSRRRNTTYVVSHSVRGEFKQVGSTCLADFIGGNSAESIAAMFEFHGSILHDLDAFCESERFGEGGSAAYDLRESLAKAVEIAGRVGWVSRSKAYETGQTATADRVLSAKRGEFEPSEASYAAADAAIEHFASLPESALVDGLTRNARVIALAGYCSAKSFGLGCALHVCYRVAMDKIDRAARHEWLAANSKHVGTVGKRQGFTATIKRVFRYETQFGVQTKTIMEDAAGNVLVGKDLGDEGETVTFVASVKEHGEYDGVKQTTVLRAKVAFLDAMQP